jgi:hypothetical protein
MTDGFSRGLCHSIHDEWTAKKSVVGIPVVELDYAYVTGGMLKVGYLIFEDIS